MKLALTIFFLIIALAVPAAYANVSDHVQYEIRINQDGSASWKLIQVTDLDSPLIGWEEFEQKLHTMIDTEKTVTGRDMSLDLKSIEMSTELNWETYSKTVEWNFIWQNFSITTENQIVFGDVFEADVFGSLYGDGELYITYPDIYILKSVYPLPNEQNDETYRLHWFRTKDFTTNPSVELELRSEYSDQLETSTIIIAVIICAAAFVAIAAFLLFNKRNKQKDKFIQKTPVKEWQQVRDSKEEVLELIKSSGGKIKQSEISKKLRYSRAKTSLLLAEMEKNNQVKRDKKGKNKIVYINNKKN